MSYILDALRRADAERERGRVPGLNAQAIDLVADEAPGRRGVAPWVWAMLGAAVVVALALLWSLLSRDEPPAALASAPPALPVAPAAPMPAPPAAAPSEPPAVPRVERPVEPAEPPARKALPRKPPRREAQAARRVAPAESPASAAAAEPPATPWAQLPEDFRRAVPELRIGGSTYSPNPASRMLIVNGLVQREGDEPAPGVTIRQIRLRSAVFEYRGQRYEVGF